MEASQKENEKAKAMRRPGTIIITENESSGWKMQMSRNLFLAELWGRENSPMEQS